MYLIGAICYLALFTYCYLAKKLNNGDVFYDILWFCFILGAVATYMRSDIAFCASGAFGVFLILAFGSINYFKE